MYVRLSASGPDGSMTMNADQSMVLHADAGAINVTSGVSFSVDIETNYEDGGPVSLEAGSSQFAGASMSCHSESW